MPEIETAAPATVPTTTPEVPATVPTTTPEPQERASKMTLKLLREKAAVKRQQEQAAAQVADAAKKIKEYDDWKKAIQTEKNPIKLLQLAGLPPEQTAKIALNGFKPPDPKEQELNDLKEKVTQQQAQWEQFQKAQKDAEAENHTTAQKEAFDELTEFVKSKPDEYPFLVSTGQFRLVEQAVAKAYKETGEIPDLDVVAKQVEADYATGLGAYMVKLATNPKVKAAMEAAIKGTPRATPETKIEAAKTDTGIKIKPPAVSPTVKPSDGTTKTVLTQQSYADKKWKEMMQKAGLK